MKKLFSIFLLVMLVVSGVIAAVPQVSAEDVTPAVSSIAVSDLVAGTVVKGEGNPTLYYIAEDGKRYVFPNSNTFFSWYDDFSEVVEIPLEDLYAYPLGGNARYKPGQVLIKIQTDPKVYAVGANGKLHWVKTEALAKAFYGDNWNRMVDDVPDSFFTNYDVDTDIDDEDDYNPEDEGAATPSISHNKGFKNRLVVQRAVRTAKQKRCEYLKNAANRLQVRAERWGLEIPSLGDDYLESCITSGAQAKVAFCQIPKNNLGNAHNVEISRTALRAEFRRGGHIGECTEEELAVENNDEEEGDVEEEEDVCIQEGETLDENTECCEGLVEEEVCEGDDCVSSCVVEVEEDICIQEGEVISSDEGEECCEGLVEEEVCEEDVCVSSCVVVDDSEV